MDLDQRSLKTRDHAHSTCRALFVSEVANASPFLFDQLAGGIDRFRQARGSPESRGVLRGREIASTWAGIQKRFERRPGQTRFCARAAKDHRRALKWRPS